MFAGATSAARDFVSMGPLRLLKKKDAKGDSRNEQRSILVVARQDEIVNPISNTVKLGYRKNFVK